MRDTFDIKWLTNGIRVSVKGPPSGNHVTMVQLATVILGAQWVVNERTPQTLKPDVNTELVQTHQGGVAPKKITSQATRPFGPWLFCTINVNRENGDNCCGLVDG